VLRSEYLVDVRSYTRVEGRPLFAAEIEQAILETISTPPSTPDQGAQRPEGGAPWA
jgi:hypothetical protein